MKKVILLIIVSIVCFSVMTACGDSRGTTSNNPIRLYIYEDPENGCQYLSRSRTAGLQPRVDATGVQLGCNE